MNINNNGDRTGAILELGRAIGDFVEDMERSEAEAVIALIAKIAHVEWTGRHVYSRQSATYARYERDEAVRQTREVEDTALAEAVRHVREVEDAALTEAVRHAWEVAKRCTMTDPVCCREHTALALWLEELQVRRDKASVAR